MSGYRHGYDWGYAAGEKCRMKAGNDPYAVINDREYLRLVGHGVTEHGCDYDNGYVKGCLDAFYKRKCKYS